MDGLIPLFPHRQAQEPLLAAAEERRGMALCCAIECTHWQIALV